MSAQRIFFVMGIVLFVATVVFLITAAYVFVSQDIRAVMDDLSGRSREANLNQVRGRMQGRRKASSQASYEGSAQTPHAQDEPIRSAEMPIQTPGPAALEVSFDIDDSSDDMPTIVTSIDQYHVGSYALDGVAAAPQEQPTDFPSVNSPAAVVPSFEVISRFVLVHSDGVITAG